MKVILENFGPIRKVEFDLSKDLNVIFGKNNIGKSYAITALYILLKHLLAEFGGDFEPHLRRLYLGSDMFGRIPTSSSINAPLSVSPTIESISIAEKTATDIRIIHRNSDEAHDYDLAEPFSRLLRELFSTALNNALNNSFANSFQSVQQLNNIQSSNGFLVTLISVQFTLCFRAQSNTLALDKFVLHHQVTGQKHEKQYDVSRMDHLTVINLKTSSEEREDHQRDIKAVLRTTEFFLSNFQAELHELAHKTYFLPASRSGLYQALNNLSAVIAELSQSRSHTTKGFSLPSFSEPVSDYFLQLSTIKPSTIPDEVTDIARQMESEILSGEVGFNEQTKKLYFRPKTGNDEMDLSFTSSMISEIAPIIAYCKYILRWEKQRVFASGLATVEKFSLSPSLIFIEEPEAHLHPEVQVKLMEFFARLTKHNVKVVMTSHSNYMFNKLSNLLLTNELEPEKVGSYLMRATPEGSVMDSAAMRAEEEGIADENFVDVAEQLYNERLQAYDRNEQ